ncbi:hypothetical protein [Pseudochelatococcus sp. G4_1912]|uniref:hypothetical protein n=1 Tax=Pseudochelatococcus sp. G4_1912 TaxID=3114288 RepID=UPI0039C61289
MRRLLVRKSPNGEALVGASQLVRHAPLPLLIYRTIDNSFTRENIARTRPAETFVAAAMILSLLFFGQVFYYLNQLEPLYYLSKAWPIIVLPMAALGMRPGVVGQAAIPLRWLFVAVLAYTIGITPLLSMLYLGNGLVDALLTTVKVLPLLFYPALVFQLAWLKPSARMLRKCVLGLGVMTFVLMVILWVTVPASWYSTDSATSKLLIYEFERGYRVSMPMFFGLLLIFYLGRQFAYTIRWYYILAIAVLFVLLFLIYKQRTTIAMAAIVVVLASCPEKWRRLAFAGGLLAAAGALVFVLVAPFMEQVTASLGASLLIRLDSLQRAITFIGDRPLNWLFGMGAVTRFSSVSMANILGSDYFFLADIGWVGVIFEYGIVGAVLIAALYIAAFLTADHAGRESGNAFALALSDYLLFMIFSSAVYSLVFVPGEMATVLALSVYLKKIPQSG